ncbi:MAG: Phosphoserine phosphatase [Candidatus Magasanikbacteria bacterium GW2011_GWC2_37_14]|uniref:phosphoserine phosphatase n=1 Tax=Candidatus Magasanikbacteria bacterium GW2011_GWC2_37_14 TaxID=1619046 RepID=A0A0G0GC62_9BACT|nr:MAG: Phosphoserine phosphatase [Candidatus Magasanikbacteria bacterium GW2011_GWC2_37_14]
MNNKIDKIYFDFDSTLIKAESLDLLGIRRGVGKNVSAMTKRSMNGEVAFSDIFLEKMQLISPTKNDLDVVAQECVGLLVAGVLETMKLLRALDKQVYILSANFYPMILPVAKKLGLDENNIIANEIFFDGDENFLNFNTSSLLAQDYGKARVLQQEKQKGGRLALVGDSVADLEAASEVDVFVGFGGVVQREKVFKESKHFVSSPSLLPSLNFLLSDDEINKLKIIGFEKIVNEIQKLTTITTTGTGPVAW